MAIYETIFARLSELHMTQTQLSKLTGIPTSTISDWKKKKINPQSDKLTNISRALQIPIEKLLGDEGWTGGEIDYTAQEKFLIETYREAEEKDQQRIIKYCELIRGDEG